MPMWYSTELELDCDNRCLAEGSIYNQSYIVLRIIVWLGGWRMRRGKLLCPECSGAREWIKLDCLRSNGMS